MTVFNAAKKTLTGANGTTADKNLPGLGSLNLKDMTSFTAVASTTGTDAKLIHGDRWQELKGNLTENIDENLKTYIKENEDWHVHENITIKIDGKTTDTRVEDVKEYYMAESTFEYFLEHTDHHHEKDHQLNPTQTFDILNMEGEYKNVDLAIKAVALEAKGFSGEVIATKAEAWGAGAEAWGVQVGAGVFENSATLLHAEEDAAEERLKGMENEIKGLQTQAEAAKIIIMPVRIGICVAIHLDSPFA